MKNEFSMLAVAISRAFGSRLRDLHASVGDTTIEDEANTIIAFLYGEQSIVPLFGRSRGWPLAFIVRTDAPRFLVDVFSQDFLLSMLRPSKSAMRDNDILNEREHQRLKLFLAADFGRLKSETGLFCFGGVHAAGTAPPLSVLSGCITDSALLSSRSVLRGEPSAQER